jgi:F0F1-type ATP synthase gamma subunit
MFNSRPSTPVCWICLANSIRLAAGGNACSHEGVVSRATRRWRRCRVKKIWAGGEHIYARLVDADLPLAGQFAVPSSVSAITSLVGKLQMASEAQGDGECAEVHVFYTRPTSRALGEPVSQRLLPLDVQWQKDLAKNSLAHEESAGTFRTS